MNHRKNVQPISKKVFIAPVISHSTYCSHKSSLTGAAPHLKGKKSQGMKERGKKRKKKIKRLLSKPNEVHLVAASVQPDAVSCTSNRNRAHLLRRKGEAIHRIKDWARQPQIFVKELLLCTPRPLLSRFSEQLSCLISDKPESCHLHLSTDTTRWGHGTVFCIKIEND